MTYVVLLSRTTVSAVLSLLIISLQSNVTIVTHFTSVHHTHFHAEHTVDHKISKFQHGLELIIPRYRRTIHSRGGLVA